MSKRQLSDASALELTKKLKTLNENLIKELELQNQQLDKKVRLYQRKIELALSEEDRTEVILEFWNELEKTQYDNIKIFDRTNASMASLIVEYFVDQ